MASPGRRPFRRVALFAGLFALFEVGDAFLGVLTRRFGSQVKGLQELGAMKQGR